VSGLVDELFVEIESGFRSDRPMSVVVNSSTNDEMVTLFNTENVKSKLKHAVITGTFDISLADFTKLFINEGAPYSYAR
jgi:precorrin-4 methylase